jgi:hypothetical protein
LKDDPACIAGQKEQEETQEENASTNAHETTKLMLEGFLKYEAAADLAGRAFQVLPAKALVTSWTNRAWHRTPCHLTTAFDHNLAPSKAPLLSGLKQWFLMLFFVITPCVLSTSSAPRFE